jgi:acyl dehydratase
MAEEKEPTIDELRAAVGKAKTEEVLEIDKSMIRAFCESTEDTNPKWYDTAPPGLLTAVMLSGSYPALKTPMPFKRGVAGGGDWEFYKPIKAGDVITTTHEFADIQDKSSEKGPRALLIFKSTHKNQKGEIVAVVTNTMMSY